MKLGFRIKEASIKIESLVRTIVLFLDYFLWLIISGDKFVRKPKKIKKVLVIDRAALGDTLNTYCIMEKLKKDYKTIDFHFFTSKAFANAINQPNVVSSKRWIIKMGNLMKESYEAPFDILILIACPPLVFKDLYSLSNYKVGGANYGITSSFADNLCLSRRIFPGYLNRIEERFKIFELAGFKFNDYKLESPSFKKYSKEAKRLIEELKIDNNKIIFFNPAASTSTKAREKGLVPSHDWSKFHKLANRLKDYQILITGTKEDEFLAKEIIRKTRHENIYSICGRTSFLGLGELMRIFKDKGVLVSIDTGTVHLGSTVGIKVIDLMGTYPKKLYYAWNNNITLYPNSGCRGCRKYYCSEKENVCMEAISEKRICSVIKKWEKK